MHRDLLVPLDAEASDRVPGLRLNWLLLSQISQHLGCLGESITTLTDTAVENQLLNLDFPHLVLELFLLLLTFHIFYNLKLLIIMISKYYLLYKLSIFN